MDEDGTSIYQELIDNGIKHLNNLTTVKSIENATSVMDLEKLKAFIPVGRDIILADFSNQFDRALYTEYHQLLTNLIIMQLSYKVKNTEGQVKIGDGIMPGVQTVFFNYINFVDGTRASGKQRERMVQADPKHSINNNIGVGGTLFGGNKQGG